MAKLHRSDFLKQLKATFPEIRQDVNQQDGLLHLEVHAFKDLTQDAIDSGDHERVIACFRLVDSFVRDGNRSLVNALAVSYLEHLNFQDGKVLRSWAKELLPSAVAEVYEDVMDYNRRLWET